MIRTVLLLAGTREAREIAAGFARPDLRLVASLAGVTSDPLAYPCETRIGGFGGAATMAEWLVRENAVAVIDATHPFAEQISVNAREAASKADIPYLRLHRTPWPLQAKWQQVGTVTEAVEALPSGSIALMTTWRSGVDAMARRPEIRFLVRSIEPIPGLPEAIMPLLDRPPYTMDSERRLMRQYGVTHLVTKDAGGTLPAKLDAAAAESISVLIVRMPPPLGPSVSTVGEAINWINALS